MTPVATTAAAPQAALRPAPPAGLRQGGPQQSESAGGRRHLEAVDVVRVAMIAGVIAVHVLAYTTSPTDVTVGAVTALLHVNREVFFLLTAFVLTFALSVLYAHQGTVSSAFRR